MGCHASIELEGIGITCYQKANRVSDESVICDVKSSRQSTARGSTASTVCEENDRLSANGRHLENLDADHREEIPVATVLTDDNPLSDKTLGSICAVYPPALIHFLTKKKGQVMAFIVSAWLDLDSIMCLDEVLIRNSIARSPWLELLRTRVEVRNRWMAPLRVDNNMVEWIVKRQVAVEFLFSRNKSLQKMNLAKSTLTDIALVRLLVNAPSLRHIDLYKCVNLSDASVVILSTLCPKMQKIDNLSMHSFSSTNFESLAKCRDLVSLNSYSRNKSHPASENISLNDVGVGKLVSVCPSIQSLDLLNCINITDSSLLHLSEHCPSLRDLRLDGCKLVTDTGLSRLSQSVPHLTLLGLAGCVRLTDAGITAVAKGCPLLKTIDISGCANVSNSSIRALAEACPDLTCLVYSLGPRITESGLSALAKKGCRMVLH